MKSECSMQSSHPNPSRTEMHLMWSVELISSAGKAIRFQQRCSMRKNTHLTLAVSCDGVWFNFLLPALDQTEGIKHSASVRRSAASHKGCCTWLQKQKGPPISSSWQEGGKRVYNIVLWLWRAHAYSRFNSFLGENLPSALTNVHVSGDQGCASCLCCTKRAHAGISLTLFKNTVTQIPVLQW